jgi:hypothetical protein
MLDRFYRTLSVRQPRHSLPRGPLATGQGWLYFDGRHSRGLAGFVGDGLGDRGPSIRSFVGDRRRDGFQSLASQLRLDLVLALSERLNRLLDQGPAPSRRLSLFAGSP